MNWKVWEIKLWKLLDSQKLNKIKNKFYEKKIFFERKIKFSLKNLIK